MFTNRSLVQLGWTKSKTWLRSGQPTEPLSSLSLVLEPVLDLLWRSCRPRRRRPIPANSDHFRRRGVGQNTLHAPLCLLARAIWVPLPLAAVHNPLGFRCWPSLPPFATFFPGVLAMAGRRASSPVPPWCGVPEPLLPCAPSIGCAGTASPPRSYGHGRLVNFVFLHSLYPLLALLADTHARMPLWLRIWMSRWCSDAAMLVYVHWLPLCVTREVNGVDLSV